MGGGERGERDTGGVARGRERERGERGSERAEKAKGGRGVA